MVAKRKKRVVPKTTRGKVAVKRLGRTKKTGGFNKISKKAGKEYGSKEIGNKVAGKIYWNMVKNRKRKKRG